MMKGALMLVVLVVLGFVHGDIRIAAEDSSLTLNEGDVVAKESVVYSRSMGLQGFPPSFGGSGSNLTALFMNMALLKRQTCEWTLPLRHPDVLILEDTLTISLTDDCECCEGLNAWWEKDIHNWCKIAPVVVLFSNQVSGFPSNSRVASDPQNTSCLVLQATPLMDGEMFGVLSRLEGTGFQVDIAIDKSAFLETTDSTAYQFFFSNLLGLIYYALAIWSALVFRKKLQVQQTHFVHKFMLIANMFQGVLLGTMTLVKCVHWLSNNCVAEVQSLLWSNLFGLSLGTDLLFCALLIQLVTAVRTSKSLEYVPMNRKVVGAGIFVACLDLFLLTFYISKNDPVIVTMVFLALPILLFFIQIIVVVFLVTTNSALVEILRPQSDMQSSNGQQMRGLVKRFKFWNRVSILSAVLACFTVSLIAFQLFYASTGLFILHITLLDLSKILNMMAQTAVVAPTTAVVDWEAIKTKCMQYYQSCLESYRSRVGDASETRPSKSRVKLDMGYVADGP